MSTSPSSPAPLSLSDLHESVIARILDLAGPRAKAAASLLLPAARAAVGTARAWSVLRFDESRDQAGLRFADFSRMLKLANGGVEEFSLASGPKAEAAELRARFLSRESRFNVPLPHTSDPDSARELGALLSGVRVLSLDERSSAVGGGTDALAAALAAAGGGKGASRLRELDLAFRPHSWASDLFSDAGLVTLARAAAAAAAAEEDEGEGEGEEETGRDEAFGLVRLRLSGAGAVSDSGLSAAAACSPFLRDFELTGYTELVSDRGISALAGENGRGGGGGGGGRERRSRRRRRPTFVSSETSSSSSSLSSSSSSSSLAEAAAAEASSSSSSSDDSEAESESLPRPTFAPRSPPPPPALAGCSCALERLCLGPRLPRVSDAGVAAVVARAPRLRFLRLPGRCTDAALLAASRAACRLALEEVDASACPAVTAEGARALVERCPRLRSLRLPPGVSL